jgi:hypothetical protein
MQPVGRRVRADPCAVLDREVTNGGLGDGAFVVGGCTYRYAKLKVPWMLLGVARKEHDARAEGCRPLARPASRPEIAGPAGNARPRSNDGVTLLSSE